MAVRGAKAWVDYLDKVELPLLSKTIKSITEISESDDVQIEELVKVILQDADLTSKVLKLANSACYNPMRVPTSTMSRAIVQVGFESIKAIAISSVLVDQLSQKSNQRQLFNCLVRSFHAAVQAKYLAADMPPEEQEAIFIAALLYDLGEAAFWSSSSPTTQALEERLASEGHCYVDDQQEVLGTSFKSISRGLSKMWSLGDLHEECLNQASSRSARIVCAAVELAHRHKHGWDKETFNQLIPAVAALTDRSATQIRKDLSKNAEQAAQLAEKFGVKGAKQFLKPGKKRTQLKPNMQSQFDALLRISELLSCEQQQFDSLLPMLLESIHFSVGLERVAFFVSGSNAGSQQKSDAYQLYKSTGEGLAAWHGRKILYIKPSHEFSRVLSDGATRLVLADTMSERLPDSKVHSAPFEGLVPALLGSIMRGSSPIGFLYADRLHEHEISNEQLCSFRLFVQQLQLCMDRKFLRRR